MEKGDLSNNNSISCPEVMKDPVRKQYKMRRYEKEKERPRRSKIGVQ